MFDVWWLYHFLGRTGQKYLCPIKPRREESPRFWRDSPAHVGSSQHAVDIIVPDPRVHALPVYAPANGTIVHLVQHYTVWGTTPDFRPFLNYVQISTEIPGEFYEICHIAANSCSFEVGDWVERGQPIATTGVCGWMTDVRHLHFMVGRWVDKPTDAFRSLRIRWRKGLGY